MFKTILGLTCMYAVLVLLVSVQFVFVIRQVYFDFKPKEVGGESDEASSDKVNASADAHSSDNKSSTNSSSLSAQKSSENHLSLSPRQRSVAKQITWDTSQVDSVMCGFDRWGYFIFITDSAITLCCLCTLINAVTLLLVLLSILPCSSSGQWISVIYQINKGALYFIFLTRIENIFADTPFGYSQTVIRSLNGLNIIGTLSIGVSMFIFVDSDHIKSGGLTWCFPGIPTLIGVSITVLDIILSVASMQMFIAPLRKIYAMELETQMESVSSTSPKESKHISKQRKKQLKKNSQVRRIAVKCRLLTFTAICSTLVAFVFAVFLGIGDMIIWDMMISTLSAMFMRSGWLDDYYETVCCIPLMMESSLKKVCSAFKN